MLEDDSDQLREQVMSAREHGQQQQVNAVQDRPLAFQNLPGNVVAENRRQENQEHHAGGNVFLQQRNILQQVIQHFQQPPQLVILENQRDVMHQLVQEAHRVRQEVKDIRNAMISALQTVDTNHATHEQTIRAQAQYLQQLTTRLDTLEAAMQAVSEAQGRLNASMLAQERESETRRARLEVLERFISEHLNDAILRLPEETLMLHRRLTTLEESTSKSQLEDRTIASMVDNHQEWQTQVEARMSDIMTDLQLKEIKLNELENSQSTNSHSRNDRVEDKLILLERQLEEQRRKILHLESIPRMTKAELNTPDKEVNRKLVFQESAQSSHSHSHNANVGDPNDSNDPNQGQQQTPPPSHSGNDKGGTGCAELRETVRRLTFWIKQITGVMDLEENPREKKRHIKLFHIKFGFAMLVISHCPPPILFLDHLWRTDTNVTSRFMTWNWPRTTWSEAPTPEP